MSEKFNSIWEREGNPFRGKISKSDFLSAWEEYLELNPFGSKKDFMKWLITEKYADIFTTQDNTSMIRKREEDQLGIYKVRDPFEKLYPKYYRGKLSEEEQNRKDRWEFGVKGLEARQRRLKETGGLQDHVVGAKHQIPMLDEDEQKRLPKSNMAELMRPKLPEETKYTDSQKAEFIREMSAQLRENPYRKWDHIQTEFARQFPGISQAVIREQEQKKRKAVRRV